MAFVWKSHKDIWKGEGVYHLTFAVAERRGLLGKLVALGESRAEGVNARIGDITDVTRPEEYRNKRYGTITDMARAEEGRNERNGDIADVTRPEEGINERYGDITDVTRPEEGRNERKYTTEFAMVKLSPLGHAISRDLREFQLRHPNILVCAKQLMENHLHVVMWVREDDGKSILQVAHGFRQGVTKIARELGVWPPDGCVTAGKEALSLVDKDGACDAHIVPYHVLDVPFIRTLSHKGQLRAMIDYVHANPDNAWMRRLNPELYTIRRRQEHAGLQFDCMGKARLLEYPDRQVVALSRSLTNEQIEDEVQKALRNAERGVVTYTAAINEGEKAVAKAVREGKYPLVVMMMGGFPAEGSEAARYFHPSGVYHQACGEGRLYLMAPHESNYQNAELMSSTEAELRRKAESKGCHYEPLPHSSTRWRMIAGNMMLEMIAGG